MKHKAECRRVKITSGINASNGCGVMYASIDYNGMCTGTNNGYMHVVMILKEFRLVWL